MRGKAEAFTKEFDRVRITPAYAGKSLRQNQQKWLDRDHPRLCGEKEFIAICAVTRLGSPPPMRGKAFKWLIYLTFIRITPAYAGKST